MLFLSPASLAWVAPLCPDGGVSAAASRRAAWERVTLSRTGVAPRPPFEEGGGGAVVARRWLSAMGSSGATGALLFKGSIGQGVNSCLNSNVTLCKNCRPNLTLFCRSSMACDLCTCGRIAKALTGTRGQPKKFLPGGANNAAALKFCRRGPYSLSARPITNTASSQAAKALQFDQARVP